jgi:hypothetical protein
MIIAEIDGLTNTIVERPATEDEIQSLNDFRSEYQATKEAEEAAKVAAKAAVLSKLGITEDELRAALA